MKNGSLELILSAAGTGVKVCKRITTGLFRNETCSINYLISVSKQQHSVTQTMVTFTASFRHTCGRDGGSHSERS